jgi:hypothetical protein
MKTFIGREIDFVGDEVRHRGAAGLVAGKVEDASPRTIFGSLRRPQALPTPPG